MFVLFQNPILWIHRIPSITAYIESIILSEFTKQINFNEIIPITTNTKLNRQLKNWANINWKTK